MEPPPILPDIEQQLREYVICLEKLPIHEYERCQEYWPRKPDAKNLFFYEGSPLCSSLKVQRDPNTGEIIEFCEAPIQDVGANARNSLSLNRAPAPPSEAVKGSAMNFPFWPGSFFDPILELPQQSDIQDTELLTVPPGFTRGISFESDGCTVKSAANTSKTIIHEPNNIVNLMSLVQKEQDLLGMWESEKTKKSNDDADVIGTEVVSLPEEEEIIPHELPVLKISETSKQPYLEGSEWAICLDTSKPVLDFHKRIPEMAYKYDFELDNFQKQAILQLEQHNHVFVAAHTSAGKTVVAEYAIALSQKHMTRTIYTSPIKALSNQKYRDFKKVFKDVGLITGDFQINQTAACLIMTTEILRSMLYCGSEVTRDLEYVIFDEVHYINDEERGHVWEQVLILLPSHVCVVLLSATVSNAIEIADWLGRTYQKKVYVIRTPKRPVPLQHFLYTGVGGSTRDNRFLIVDNDGWNMEGYNKAIAAVENLKHKKDKSDKTGEKNAIHKKEQKRTSYRPMTEIFSMKQEKTLWYSLVDHLIRNDLLPVVAFVFSRNKCDLNAENLSSLDLTTQKEKDQIHMIFKRCIKTLKEPDKQIPQILSMENILKRGIGVHHSGVLPILKEMVEILFQKELIKILFATETFAMGVNMPTKTVVFDSIEKHDGKSRRVLLPAEYIQMAGRAGRRGMDSVGTVIILCKNKVPSNMILKKIISSIPDKLNSQFRLTYGMVLSLLRVESLSVEGMMSRSFREVVHQKDMVKIREELKQIQNEIVRLTSKELGQYLQPLVTFYDYTSSYLKHREQCIPKIIESPNVSKMLIPGRVVLIIHKNHINKLGLILQMMRSAKPAYKVLILADKEVNAEENIKKPDFWYKMLGISNENTFIPVGVCDHKVITINPVDIFEISAKTIKVDTELICKDWDKRQIPRFQNDPPGQSCNLAIQELLKLSTTAKNEIKDNKLEYLDFIHDLKVTAADLYEDVMKLERKKGKIVEIVPSTHIPNFEQQFEIVFERKFLEDRKNELELKLSYASLSLYPDYQNTISLLQELKYVDSQNRVELKGRVACEMGMNELLITELVLRNILTKLEPAEVAALLSSLVCQVKVKEEQDLISAFSNLSNQLKNAIEETINVHKEITELEKKYYLDCNRFGNELNFALVEVVYNWATAKPFAEIMELVKDVQEGIIVRCIQQLNETICDVKDAAHLIGDPELQKKMEDASAAIKRDIVFAASLYTQNELITI